jgi:hypothetical protein
VICGATRVSIVDVDSKVAIVVDITTLYEIVATLDIEPVTMACASITVDFEVNELVVVATARDQNAISIGGSIFNLAVFDPDVMDIA